MSQEQQQHALVPVPVEKRKKKMSVGEYYERAAAADAQIARKQREYDQAVRAGQEMDEKESNVKFLSNQLVQYVLNWAVRLPTDEKVKKWLASHEVQRALLRDDVSREKLAQSVETHELLDATEYQELSSAIIRCLLD